MSIKVLLVDDQALVREGIQSLLSLNKDILVVGQACNGEEAIDFLHNNNVDVVLLDIRMPKMDGIATLTKMAQDDLVTPVLMLTTFDDSESILSSIKAGARGYLLKDISLESLVSAIETVAAGKTLIQPAITESLHQRLPRNEEEQYELIEPISDKEREILRLMAAGLSNQEIAEAAFKSVGTVKNQVSAILAKLNVRDRTRAVLKAIEMGLLD